MSTVAAASASRIPFARAMTDESEIVSRALASESSCDVSVIRDRTGFDALEVEWTALFERVGRPEQLFQTFEWLSCWADHFLDATDSLRIVVGRRDGRLVMVWPLMETQGPLGFTKLAWMGEPVGQYGDALIEPGPAARASLAAGWRAVRALNADAALLRKTRADSNVATLLGEEALLCEQTLAPFARFGGKADFTAALSHRSAKTQSSRRRLLRRLKETGVIAFESGADTASAPKLLRRAFAMKREWLLRRGLYSGPIESDAMLAFFVDFATRAPKQVTTLIDAIRRDGEAVSIGVTLACKGVGFGHILAHDTDCDKQGAGVLLAEHVMKSCFERGFERYDMLAPYDAYKSEWADDSVPVADYVMGFTPRGRIFARLWSSAARQRIKAALKKMPARIGRVVWPLARKASRKRALFNGQDRAGQDRARDQGVTSSPSRFPESAS
jgi:CelD/BcsL family acetyltransferase involved in cellulose biosynthesis